MGRGGQRMFVLKDKNVIIVSKDYYLILDIEDGGKQRLAMGMGNRYVISREHLFGLPVALRSYWEKDKLHVEYNGLSGINLYRFTFGFDNDSVDFKAGDITNKRNISLKARAAN